MTRKALVIGLDAADLDVMRPLIDRGKLPVIAGLLADGAHGVLHSTVPPVSAPAWATFMTGTALLAAVGWSERHVCQR